MGASLAFGSDEAALALPLDGKGGVPFVDSLDPPAFGASALEAADQFLATWDALDFPAVDLAGMAAKVHAAGVDPLIGTSSLGPFPGDPIAVGDQLTGLAVGAARVDRAGNTMSRACNLGTLNGTRTVSDWVGKTDTNDYYRFDLAQTSSLSLNLNGMSADADLRLLSSTGAVLASSVNGGTTADSISCSLAAGTYYAQVQRYSGNTNYNLTLTAAAPTTPAGFSSTNGYGEASVERAIESLLGVSIADQANQFGAGLYGLDRIGAPEVWNYGYTGEGLVVAVLDTGVDRNHQDLDANTWVNAGELAGNGVDDDGNGYVDDVYGWNFSGNNNNTLDVNGHGTHVAGSIAAERNDFGVTGVAYDAQIMSVKVLSDAGYGYNQGIADGIRYAVDNGANVINLSLGGSSPNSELQNAIQYAWSSGVAVVMAAGNSGASMPGYPAAYANQWGMAVGAVDSTGALASFSNRAGSAPIDYVTASGVAVTSTTPNNSYATYSGTSMATPYMAGAMALLMQANLESGSNRSIGQLEQLFTSTATNMIGPAMASTVASTSAAATGIAVGSSLPQRAADAASEPSPSALVAKAVASTSAPQAPSAAVASGSSPADLPLIPAIDASGFPDLPAVSAEAITPASSPLASAIPAVARTSLRGSFGAEQLAEVSSSSPIAGTSRDPLISPWERSRAGADEATAFDLLTAQLSGRTGRVLAR